MMMSHLWILFNLVMSVYGTLTVRPEDTVAVLESPVQLTCRTNLTHAVKWTYTSSITGRTDTIYNSDHVMVLRYLNRGFSVERKDDYMNLTINSVSYADAGRYKCTDDEGEGEAASAELVVVGAALNCSDNTGAGNEIIPLDVNCSPGPDKINLTCTLQYSGNIAPVLTWTITGTSDVIGDDVINETVANQMARYTLITNLNTTAQDISYTCQTKIPFDEITDVAMNWISSKYSSYYLNALDSQLDKMSKSICVASTNMRDCTTKLYLEDLNRIEGQTDLDSVLQDGGSFCYTECKVRDATCSITYRPILSTHKSATDGRSGVLEALVGLFAGLSIALLIIVALKFRSVLQNKLTSTASNTKEKLVTGRLLSCLEEQRQ